MVIRKILVKPSFDLTLFVHTDHIGSNIEYTHFVVEELVALKGLGECVEGLGEG